MFDFHMHSNFSADGDFEMEAMVQSAIQKGLKEICFTDHLDIDYPDKDWDFTFDPVRYTETIEQLQEKYQNKITILKGVEVGVQPHVLHATADFVNSLQPDFVICSMHATRGTDLHSGEFFQEKSIETAFRQYFEELYACIQKFDSYQVLGHVDLVRRYAKQTSKDECFDILESILKLVINQGKGIELNTSGFKYGLEAGLPSKEILELYHQLGGEILTIGSDAHRPNEISQSFRQSLELLQSIGFNYITSFEEQVPKFTSIEKVKNI
ncbi:histidinol-phosphatase [Oceanobacillus iheyensis]|uniref:histidinol-phosphatase n=1 Tax=Oceanobacillus iheyensis TaxID=182710 RepID=UPI00364285AA